MENPSIAGIDEASLIAELPTDGDDGRNAGADRLGRR